MKNIQFLLTVVLTLGTLLNTGCKKNWLDQKPDKNLTVPETLKDFEALLDNSSINYSALDIGEVSSDGHYLRADYFQYLDDTEKNAYTWTHDRAYFGVPSWDQSFNVILTVNMILDGLKKTSPSPTEQKKWNEVKGNALFTRARLFFELAQIWTPIYRAENAVSQLGIPLRLVSDITIPSTRPSLQQVYDQVINDLVESLALLPNLPIYKTRGSKIAVYGELAKTYLVKGDFKKARENANASLQLYHNLLDFNSLDPLATYIGLNNDEVIYHCKGRPYVSAAYAYIEPSLFNLFDKDDLRRDIYFAKNTDGTISFKGNYNNDNMVLFMGLATDELYLIRAECYAREGNTELAMKDLNTLLKSRWSNKVPFPKFTAVDAEDALRQILTERRKELILRGVRWSDLKRLNLEPEHATTLTREADGKEYTLEPNSYKYTFPIPDDVIQLSGMQQNEGWVK